MTQGSLLKASQYTDLRKPVKSGTICTTDQPLNSNRFKFADSQQSFSERRLVLKLRKIITLRRDSSKKQKKKGKSKHEMMRIQRGVPHDRQQMKIAKRKSKKGVINKLKSPKRFIVLVWRRAKNVYLLSPVKPFPTSI